MVLYPSSVPILVKTVFGRFYKLGEQRNLLVFEKHANTLLQRQRGDLAHHASRMPRTGHLRFYLAEALEHW